MKQIKTESFTLIELLVVIAIIGILAGFMFIRFAGFTDKAKISKAKSMLGHIYSAMVQLELDSSCWPKSPSESFCKTPYIVEEGASNNEIWNLNDQSVGLAGDSTGVFPNWQGPYIQTISKYPWNNDYFLDTDYDIDPGPGSIWAAVIGSFGPNGVGQNLYDQDDVIRILVTE